MDPVVAGMIAVLGFSSGIFASHATLGNKITRALTLLESVDARVTKLETRPHFHRRSTDSEEDEA